MLEYATLPTEHHTDRHFVHVVNRHSKTVCKQTALCGHLQATTRRIQFKWSGFK